MKKTVVITLFFAIITAAVFGCLVIFDAMSVERALELLLKFEAAIVLLGGCTMLIAVLFRRNSID
ncbi:MAG: hypothetical protein OEW73_00215 [Gammaproteobacteria bacterium]|nr:hypothetical protein [Gammaproteobacteria bacterium]MDH5582427.1 hypothetical protein [Gammaproteobacteria bacterium]